MHELSLAESMLQIVEAAAEREGARRVRRIVLEIGRLACVEVDALCFCFASVAADGPAAGADLDIVDIPGAGICDDCGASAPMDAPYGECPACGGYRMRPTAGTAMRVSDIEIE